MFQYSINMLNPDKTSFIAGATSLSGIPKLIDIPIFVFVGRSNVGKSSLLSAIFAKPGFVRVSSKPGSTRQINIFSADNKFYMIDLPGYGYARRSKNEQNQWEDTIIRYLLENRLNIKKIFLLIDSRHEAKQSDIDISKVFDKFGLSYQIVYTKIDKVGVMRQKELGDEFKKIFDKSPASYPEYIIFSDKDKKLVNGIKNEIIKTLNNS